VTDYLVEAVGSSGIPGLAANGGIAGETPITHCGGAATADNPGKLGLKNGRLVARYEHVLMHARQKICWLISIHFVRVKKVFVKVDVDRCWVRTVVAKKDVEEISLRLKSDATKEGNDLLTPRLLRERNGQCKQTE
jgi:hypothetical protein